MVSFWPLLCRIVLGVEGTLGVILNVTALAVLWNRKMRAGWSTYRIGITVAALHGIIMSAMAGLTSLSHIFHNETYLLVFYGVNCPFPRAVNDVILFTFLIVVIGLWELIPASCILQYLALCRSYYSNGKRLFIAYATCSLLAASSIPFYHNLFAPSIQIARFELLTREIHNLTDDVFVVYGMMLHASTESDKSAARLAMFAIVPSYCMAYGIFVFCCVKIYRAINNFGIQLSQRTIALQRSFLGMLITQGWLPLAVLSIPVGVFITAVVTGMAMDLYSLILTFSLWLVPSVQGAVSLSYVLRMKSSTPVEHTANSKSRTSANVVVLRD